VSGVVDGAMDDRAGQQGARGDVEPKIAQRQIDAVSIADLDPVDL